MKKLILFIIAMLFFNTSWAQDAPPEMFKFQAYIYKPNGNPVSDKTVGVEIAIYQTAINGVLVYSEVFTTTTNKNGTINLAVGNGTPTFGIFAEIPWATGEFFIKLSADINGGTNYTAMGASQLLSVPYALYAKTAQFVDGDNDTDPTNEIELPEEDGTEGQILTTDGEGNLSWQTPSVSVESCGLSIGDTYAGGIIFYLDGSGCHGLVCAPTDQTLDVPAYPNFGSPSATDNGIGLGAMNTEMIVNRFDHATVSFAAKICSDLTLNEYNDWYLPSKYELLLMQKNIGGAAEPPNTNIGGFTIWERYWSSTELEFSYPYDEVFIYNIKLTDSKVEEAPYNNFDANRAVRAVRAF